MQAHEREYYRMRMLEEQLRAQNCGGAMRELHLGWAELYEKELRRRPSA